MMREEDENRRIMQVIDVTNSDNVMLTNNKILSFCYLQSWHNSSKLSRHCLDKISANSN